MTTLFDVMFELANMMGATNGGTSTASSTTTLTDPLRNEVSDFYNGGTLFLIAAALSKSITDWDQTTHVYTFTSALSATPDAALSYAATTISKDKLKQAINSALVFMGLHTGKNETLTVVEGQHEYTIPSGVGGIVKIDVLGSDGTFMTEIKQFWEITGLICFRKPIPCTAGNTIRLYHNKLHDRLDDDDDVINSLYNPKRVIYTAALKYLEARMNISGNKDMKENLLYQSYTMQVQRLAQAFPVNRIERRSILNTM